MENKQAIPTAAHSRSRSKLDMHSFPAPLLRPKLGSAPTPACTSHLLTRADAKMILACLTHLDAEGFVSGYLQTYGREQRLGAPNSCMHQRRAEGRPIKSLRDDG